MTRRCAISTVWLVLMLTALPGAAQAAPPASQADEVRSTFTAEREVPPPAVDSLAPAAPAETPPAPVEPPPAEVVEAPPAEVVEAPPAEVVEAPPPAGDPQPTPEPVAVNRARTVQVVVQVQVGCRHHCEGTSQTQTAVQEARTEQTAVAPGGAASNESTTEQYVWQLQLGCVFFCVGTVQTQTVEQHATTTQTAVGTDASNSSSTVQVAHQLQPSRRRRTLFADIDAWLRELSLDVTVTVQVIRQVQVADCRHHCTGGSQVQLAEQHALTVQEAATAALPPPGRD